MFSAEGDLSQFVLGPGGGGLGEEARYFCSSVGERGLGPVQVPWGRRRDGELLSLLPVLGGRGEDGEVVLGGVESVLALGGRGLELLGQ